MLSIIRSRADDNILKQVAEDFEGYIKVVVDINKEILTAGGLRHVEGEELLLEDGSKQKDLWGGGLDLETGEIDFDSMINLRSGDNNSSREVLSQEIRDRMVRILHELLR